MAKTYRDALPSCSKAVLAAVVPASDIEDIVQKLSAALINWEKDVTVALKMTYADILNIKAIYAGNPKMERLAVMKHGMSKLGDHPSYNDIYTLCEGCTSALMEVMHKIICKKCDALSAASAELQKTAV